MENSKEQLRKIYKLKRKNIENKAKKDNSIFYQIIQNEQVCKADTILLYYSTKEEIDTLHLIEYFLSNHKKVALPKVIGKSIIFHYITSLNDKKLGKYNIFEPVNNNPVIEFSNSICIVPGICFDSKNYRVGYGGGYYDRFLSTYKGYSIGLTYQECLIDSIEIDDYDQCVDLVITD